MTTATGSFELTSWQEDDWVAFEEGARTTRADVTQRFDGDIVGDGAVQWLMAYRPDGAARFVGLQQVRGAVAGREGTFVLETSGEFEGGVARWTASVIAGSGTGDLAGLSGDGSFEAPHGSTATFSLDLELG
jgi:hypothetical protein